MIKKSWVQRLVIIVLVGVVVGVVLAMVMS
jgi:hypothetical protein